MKDFYMYININQHWILYSFEKYRLMRRMNTNPNFPNWLIQIFYFAIFNFLQISHTNNIFNKLLHIVLYLVNIILENLIVPCGFEVLRKNLLLLTRCTYRKIVISFVFGIFLSFQPHTKGYLFINLQNHKVEVSRHVIFYESHFPYKLKDDVTKSPNNLSLPIPLSYNSNYEFLSLIIVLLKPRIWFLLNTFFLIHRKVHLFQENFS